MVLSRSVYGIFPSSCTVGLQRDKKLGRITRDLLVMQSVEILSALKKLGEEVQISGPLCFVILID